MAGTLAILLTFVTHVIFRTTFLIHQREDYCPEYPPIASIIVYLSILYLLYETKARPEYWTILPGFCKFIMELLHILLAMELSLHFWINVEINSRNLLIDIFDTDYSRHIGLHILLMYLSLNIFIFVGVITNLFGKLKKMYEEFRIKWKSIKIARGLESNRSNSVET